MRHNRIEIIRQGLETMIPDAARIGDIFHERLFEIAPEMKPLFEDFFASGGNKFRVVSEVVNLHLRSLLAIPVTPDGEKAPVPPAVRALGQRHMKFNLTEADFSKMKEALLWTIEHAGGDKLAQHEREAWEAAFDCLAEMMQRSMKTAEAPAPTGDVKDFLRAAAPSAEAADPLADFFRVEA